MANNQYKATIMGILISVNTEPRFSLNRKRKSSIKKLSTLARLSTSIYLD